MIYDIRTKERALETLVNLTGIPYKIWSKYSEIERSFENTDQMIEYVIKEHGGRLPSDYRDWNFVYFHITTSNEGCENTLKYGILDLVEAYRCEESELRCFLEAKEIYIDLDAAILSYRDRDYDISYGRAPHQGTEEYYCWSIGYRFYYDYTTCGFLSVYERNPYGGRVHCRPEILQDIDNLLGTELSIEWEDTHSAYEVVAQVSGRDIVYDGEDYDSDKSRVLNYLALAYYNAFWQPGEKVLLLKNGVQIPPNSILEIKRCSHWERLY